jgi:tRNA/tmRNA/rRNA uracil-C5-methylase (TrmA/RlmC/RlmD family)
MTNLVKAVEWELKLEDCTAALIDLSCQDAGLLSLALSSKVNKCIVVGDKVGEARANAELNDIRNCRFFDHSWSGTELAEHLELLRAHPGPVMILACPGKGGLDFGLMKAIRECDRVHRIVYVSDKPEDKRAVSNFNALGEFNVSRKERGKKALSSKPFRELALRCTVTK